jgi:hypothetical protein
MKTVHEFFTNKRMDDSRFEYSWFHSWMVVHVASVAARVESLRGRMGESERQVEGLFESLLAESFDGGR